MSGPTDGELRAAGVELQVDRIRANFEETLTPQARIMWDGLLPGGSMKAFAENWPVVREQLATLGQTSAETMAAVEQSIAAWKEAQA